jgi:hypothetical protein
MCDVGTVEKSLSPLIYKKTHQISPGDKPRPGTHNTSFSEHSMCLSGRLRTGYGTELKKRGPTGGRSL